MISVESLSKYYGSFKALDRVSFQVGTGEILGLLGPNGAGKTTTMRILAGYLPPSSGTARIGGIDVLGDPRAVKRLIGYLPEFAPLYADMLVHDYLSFVASVRGQSPDRRNRRIAELAVVCGLGEVMHRPFRELSRGYKQRVGLAHALIGDPEVLILDEPTSGLDPNQIVDIRNIIRDIGREKTVIFSTHILSEAEATCDRIIIIDRGRLVADGTSETIKTSGRFRFRLSLVGARFPEVSARLSKVAGVLNVEQESNEGTAELRVQVGSDRDNRAELSRIASEHDWSVIEFTTEKGSLEDTFRELTRSDPNSPSTPRKRGKRSRR